MVGVKKICIKNNKFTNTNGTLPEYGIDIEPWQSGIYNNDIIIDNNIFENNNGGGIDIFPWTKNLQIINNTFVNNGISSVMDLNNGEESYPKNVIINKNNFQSSSIYFRGTRYAEYTISENSFENSRFSIDGDLNFKALTGNEKGFIRFINNTVIGCKTSYFMLFYGACNTLINNNVFNSIKGEIIDLTQCKTGTFSNNIINRYCVDTSLPASTVPFSIGTAVENYNFFNNTIVGNENDVKVDYLIKIHRNASFIIIKDNVISKDNYSNLLLNESNSLLFDNITNTNYKTTTNLPSPSAQYAGIIYNRIDNNNNLIPTICTYNSSSGAYEWKNL